MRPDSRGPVPRIHLACLALSLILGACTPPPRISAPSPPPGQAPAAAPASLAESAPSVPTIATAIGNGDQAPTADPIETVLDSPARPTIALQAHRIRTGGTTLTILTFDGSTHHLAVVDNENGPGTGATTSKAAAKAAHGVAAINAGFFTPEGSPLGLVIENGREFGALTTSSLGAGLYVHAPEADTTHLIRRRSWVRPATIRHLLQSGPFLVENSRTVPGLSSGQSRPRSFLLWDGHQGWAIGQAKSATLSGLASTLARQPVPGFTIQSALNLDGGTSSDLWIASSVKGGPASTRQFWNKAVRNHLVLRRHRP